MHVHTSNRQRLWEKRRKITMFFIDSQIFLVFFGDNIAKWSLENTDIHSGMDYVDFMVSVII